MVAGALAITLQPLQFRLVQLLEGYWPARSGSLIFRLGVWCQRGKRNRLVGAMSIGAAERATSSWPRRRALEERVQVAEDAVRTRFPEEDRLLPTSLGNVLRSAEDRLGLRYGIDTVVIWPRLFRLLPDAVAKDIDDEMTQLDVSVRLAVTWFFTALGAISILVATDRAALAVNWEWWTVPTGLVLLSCLSYRGAIESALAHGSDIEVGLDLYRGRVTDAMRLPDPARLSEERSQFGALGYLFTSYSADDEFDLEYRGAAGVPSRRARRVRWRMRS